MNRIDRLVATVLLLQSKRLIRAEDIARHFSISLRTVYRDMRSLDEAGVPVAAEAGEGYSLASGYHLPPVMFTKEEASALFIGSELAKQFTDDTLRTHIETALLKVRSVLPAETQEHLDALGNATFIAPRYASKPQRGNHTAAIQEAIASRRVLRIDYYSYLNDESTKRTVEPLGMIYYAERWHLIAYCRLREDIRDFRTDRIESLALKDETFPKRKDFSFKEHFRTSAAMEKSIEVQVWFDKKIVRFASEKEYYGLVGESRADGGIVMTFLVAELAPISHWLLSFGTSVQIGSPDTLRAMLRAEAETLAKHYQ